MAAAAGTTPKRPAVPVPSPRQVAWLLRKGDAQLTDDERAYRAALDAACPALAEARAVGDRVAAGIQRDRDAVLAALCFPWSNGQVEGQVHRLKLVKRTMYGRAGSPLLRARVLHAA